MIADAVILVIVGLLAVAGWQRGFGALAIFAGAFLAGASAGGPLAWLLLGERRAGPVAVLAGLAAVFAAGIWLGDVRQFLHRASWQPRERELHGGVRGRLERRVRHRPFERDIPGDRTDRVMGAVAYAAFGLVVAWWGAAVFAISPATPAARPFLRTSHIDRALDSVVSRDGATAGRLVRVGLLPGLPEPQIRAGAPDPAVVDAPPVARAGASVVFVTGMMCGHFATGSGWIAAPGIVVTNAHVVAGVRSIEVRVRRERIGASGRTVMSVDILPARLVRIDTVNDVALLRVPDLPQSARPFPLADGEPGAAAATVRFDYAQPGYAVVPMRYDRTRRFTLLDLYGRRARTSWIAIVRGPVLPGDSGSALVNARGEVVATMTAAATTSSTPGGYGVPAPVLRDLLRDVPQRTVGSGPCTADVAHVG